MTFATALLLVAALGVASLLTGRLLVGALGAGMLRRLDPAAAAASFALGTATLTLGAVWLSAAGWPAPDVVRLLAALHLIPLALCWRRGQLEVFRPRGPARAWLGLLGPATAAAVLALLPVLRTDGFSIGNDTYTYGAYAEWLQRHGFAEAALLDPMSPVDGIPRLWQQLHYDLGIAHLLALVQAAAGASVSLLVYPSVSAWGMVLLACGVFLALRWLLRLPQAWAAMAALLFAAVPHPVYWGHHGGSLQQTYALALLLLAVVLFARAAHPRWWRPATAVLLAVAIAFFLVVYLPMLPLVGAAAAVAPLAVLARARRRHRRRGLAFAGIVAALAVVFALRDVLGLVARYSQFLSDVTGGHIPYGPLEFAQFAAGTRVLAPGWTNLEVVPWSALNRTLTPLYLGLATLGLGAAAWRARTRGLAAVAVVLLAGLGHYAFFVQDPWQPQTGHTWNLFKLSQWAFPTFFLLAVFGARRVSCAVPAARRLAAALLFALPFSLIGVHWAWSERLGLTMRQIYPSPAPLRELPQIKRRIQALPPGTLLVVGRPASANRWLAAYTALVAYPRAVVGDWWASASISNHPLHGEALYTSLLERIGRPGVVPLLAGFVPFQTTGVEELGGGFAHLLETDRPAVVHVANPGGLATDAASGRPSFDLSGRRAKIVVFSSSEITAELRGQVIKPGVDLSPAPVLRVFAHRGDNDHRVARLAVEAGPLAEVRLAERTAFRVPLALPRGLTTLVLTAHGTDAAESPPRVVELGAVRVDR